MGLLDNVKDRFKSGYEGAKDIGGYVTGIPGRMKNWGANVYDDKVRNAGFKSEIKRLMTMFKAEIIDMVKKMQEGLVKDAQKAGRENIKASKKQQQMAHSPLRRTDKLEEKAKSPAFMKDINKEDLSKGKSKAIISGGRDSIGKGLENPFTR